VIEDKMLAAGRELASRASDDGHNRGQAPPLCPREYRLRALFLLISLSAFATAARAQVLEVIGYAGYLGEWELTATVTESVANGTKEFSGPLNMKHVGLCSQDGPEEKSGEMRLRLSGSSEMKATLSVDGVECTYSGTLSDFYKGMMNCAVGRAAPLTLWVK
jgi:hypothetical protein